MPIGSYIAIYFVVWWTVLFAVLPWGARSQREAGAVVPGSEPGAPAIFRAWPKIIATSIVAAIVTAGLFWLLSTPFIAAYLRQ
jgi:predicted secreted protein